MRKVDGRFDNVQKLKKCNIFNILLKIYYEMKYSN